MDIKDFVRKNKKEILYLDHKNLAGRGSLPLLKFHLLEETGIVEHCFTTRAGGVSRGIYESMNLSYSRGDEPSAVDENFRRLAEALSVSVQDFVCSDQTHTTNIKRVSQKEKGCGIKKERSYRDVDGLITNEPGVVLATFYADCVPLYFVDPVHHAIGLSHSGWRGTVGRMGEVTLRAMEREFGTRPEDVFAAVGPSICQSCYEIGQDVADQFMAEFPEQKQQILTDKGNGSYQLDLWKCNEIVLTEAGIQPSHLAVTNICSCCNPKLLFSHRASQGKRGNMGAFLALRSFMQCGTGTVPQ